MSEEITVWIIRITGYGTFQFTGTEQEAEEMRKHKAQWERGCGRKWRADLMRESDKINAAIAGIFDKGQGVPSEMLRSLHRAKKKEESCRVQPEGQ